MLGLHAALTSSGTEPPDKRATHEFSALVTAGARAGIPRCTSLR